MGCLEGGRRSIGYVDDPRIKALQANVDYPMEIVTNADFGTLKTASRTRGWSST